MKDISRPITIFLLSTLIHFSLAAATFTSVASGQWSVAATWDTGAVPTATDDVIIAGNHQVTVGGAASADVNSIVVGSSASLFFTGANGSSAPITIRGTLGTTSNPTPISFTGQLTNNGAVQIFSSLGVSFTGGVVNTRGSSITTASAGLITFSGIVDNQGTIRGQIIFDNVEYPTRAPVGDANGSLIVRNMFRVFDRAEFAFGVITFAPSSLVFYDGITQSGSLYLQAGTVTTIQGSITPGATRFTDGGQLVVFGELSVVGDIRLEGRCSIIASNFGAGGIINLTSGNIYSDGTATLGAFGTLNIPANGPRLFNVNLQYVNGGTVNFPNDTGSPLTWEGGWNIYSGRLEIEPNDVHIVNRSLEYAGAITGDGRIIFERMGILVPKAGGLLGDVGNRGTLEIRDNPNHLTQFGTPTQDIVLGFSKVIMTDGSIILGRPDGDIIVERRTDLITQGSASITRCGALINNGTIEITGTSFYLETDLTNNFVFEWTSGDVEFQSTRRLVNGGDLDVEGNPGQFNGDILNASLFRVSNLMTTFSPAFTGAITNTGSVRAAAGASVRFTGPVRNESLFTAEANSTIVVEGRFTLEGSGANISGPGDFTVSTGNGLLSGLGNVTTNPLTIENGARFQPGASLGEAPGCMPISNLTVANGGTLEMTVDGTGPCTEFDQLLITNQTVLAGSLDIDFAPNATFAAGDRLTIISGPSLVGAFSSDNLDPGSWEIRYNEPTAGDVSLLNVTASQQSCVLNETTGITYPDFQSAVAAVPSNLISPQTLRLDPACSPFGVINAAGKMIRLRFGAI